MATERNKDFKITLHTLLPSSSGMYVINKFLGSGNFGNVARCVKFGTNEEKAIKIVHRKDAFYGDREVNMLRKLIGLDINKNNLVKFFEHFEYKGHCCIVFEMLDISLWDFMKKRNFSPLSLSEIQVITQQLLVALKALKNIGLAHTDIKPDNVMLVNHQLQPFKVKLIDFGLAYTASLLKRGALMQPLGYRAPEVILGLQLGEAIDMWSLGCNVAFMHIGRHLYDGECDYELLRDIVQIQGQPDDHLLSSGIKTTQFFSKVQDLYSPSWRLKTKAEYELETGYMIDPYVFKWSSLDEMARTRKKSPYFPEYEDTEAILSLLKGMLHLDPEKRITPKEALQHQFITMNHLPNDTNNNSTVTIEVRPLEKSSVEHTSSTKVTSLSGSTAGKPQAKAGLNETCTAGPIYRTKASTYRISAGNNNRPPSKNEAASTTTNEAPSSSTNEAASTTTNEPPSTSTNEAASTSTNEAASTSTNEAASLASINGNSKQTLSTIQSGSDEETSGFVKVKTRKTFLKRINRFFSRMMRRISCCRVDVVE